MKIIRWPAIKEMIGGVSRSTLDRWEKAGNFPKRIHLGKNAIAWRVKDIEKWLKELK